MIPVVDKKCFLVIRGMSDALIIERCGLAAHRKEPELLNRK